MTFSSLRLSLLPLAWSFLAFVLSCFVFFSFLFRFFAVLSFLSFPFLYLILYSFLHFFFPIDLRLSCVCMRSDRYYVQNTRDCLSWVASGIFSCSRREW